MAHLFVPDQYDKVLNGLKHAKADLKLLSVHFGAENQTSLNGGQFTTTRPDGRADLPVTVAPTRRARLR